MKAWFVNKLGFTCFKIELTFMHMTHCGNFFLVPVNQLLLVLENLAVPTTCQLENGGCEHFCNEGIEGQRLNCSCADGYFLGEDGQSCTAIGRAVL